ncbi:unnamed protein product [Albugo candida]|uniref:Acyl-CoA dehydrogenase/oxidase N-terminal domain-containing protein n=1 Tax=Albugo candida TaxID=65357 RepID=A0A024GL33_9STRA|nr:unnamed protein product [Albugo candida]|eukprot:CCI47404.1 unnamed protein product [Albugo candida]
MRAAFLRALPLRSQHIQIRLLQTAAEAASTVSYTRGLFLGVNNAERAFPYPKVSVEEQETLQLLVTSVAKYFENVDSKQIDEKKKIPDETLNELKELGLFGLQIEEQWMD